MDGGNGMSVLASNPSSGDRPREGSAPLSVVWSADYEMDLGRHVFPTEKYRLVHVRLLEEGVIRERHVHHPKPVDWEHLRLVHTEGYLEKLRGGSFDQAEVWRMELPFSPAVREAFRTCCGGSILAGELALDRKVSIHLGGGFHHAFPDHGEGFCLLNDVAVAVRTLRSAGRLRRAAVVDCDVHHGNGTAAIFQSDPRTYTLSLHQSDLYPARKPRGDLDVGMPAGTGDRRYLRALDDALEEMFGAIEPDLILYLAGADPYRRDQLGGLKLTREGLARRDRAVLERAREAATPIVVLLAGGYAHRLEDTVEIHARTVGIARQVLDECP
jgi:acetoin utilization deacetylase AcuC-like enzyme